MRDHCILETKTVSGETCTLARPLQKGSAALWLVVSSAIRGSRFRMHVSTVALGQVTRSVARVSFACSGPACSDRLLLEPKEGTPSLQDVIVELL